MRSPKKAIDLSAAVRTLLIDNYDSFTFNLYQLIAKVNGTPPIVVRNDGVTWRAIEALDVDNIVISPGPGRPERPADFGVSADVILHSHVPILGVCLGHQGLAHAFGGQVIHAPEEMHGRLSRIRHDGSTLFSNIPEEFEVVRYHSLVVDADSLPDALTPNAWTNDGLIMGLAHKTRPLFGVQFHPESICTEYGETLLTNFRDLTPRRSRSDSGINQMEPLLPRGHQAPSDSDYSLHFKKLDWHDPEQVFEALYAQSASAFWLDSNVSERARFSFIGDATGPLALTLGYGHREETCTIKSQDGHRKQGGSVFDVMREVLRERSAHEPTLPFGFQGGFVGYLGYGLKAECGGDDEHPAQEPDAQLHFCDRFIAFDHHQGEIYLVALTGVNDESAVSWMSHVEESLPAFEKFPQPALREVSPASATPSRTKSQYLKDIQSCLDAIRQGESYELCLTNMLHVDAQVDALALHRELRRRSPAPYAALLRFDGLDVVSSSPERFLRIEFNGHVESKPIKGTRARGASPEEDAALARELAQSEKERAENLMIVDLVRNDLGQVCEVGSVHVPTLMAVETYATVHQLVSTVVGQLRPDADAIDCIRCAFPGGSMTGAPKRRTMSILDSLEVEARSVYSGAIGYLSVNGSVDLSIAIRCALVRENHVRIGTGGAIVALSDPEAEFEETQLKARAVLEAIAAVEQTN
ncbi:MAG: para-aminobenzoate synthetase [Polyangiales bacterium]